MFSELGGGMNWQTNIEPRSRDPELKKARRREPNALLERRIPPPGPIASLVPVVGPAWQVAADLEERDYLGAALNAGFLAADILPVGVGIRGVRAARMGIGAWKTGSVSADAARKMMKARGFTQPGQEVHHTFALRGKNRNAQDWRNHYAFLKPLPREIHRRLHGRWNGAPKYGPAARLWHGTTDWQKAAPTAIFAKGADAGENAVRPTREVVRRPAL